MEIQTGYTLPIASRTPTPRRLPNWSPHKRRWLNMNGMALPPTQHVRRMSPKSNIATSAFRRLERSFCRLGHCRCGHAR